MAVDPSGIAALRDVEQVRSVKTPIRLDYSYTAGIAQTKFLRAIEQKRLIGQRCPKTGHVYVPSRGASPESGLPTEGEVELAHVGTVTTYCIVNVQFYGQAMEVPYVSAHVLPDGADIPLFGLIQEIDPSEIRMGLRVEAVWVPDEELTTSLANIKWWRPNGEPDADYETYRHHV